jgi:adenylate cyclase class 2
LREIEVKILEVDVKETEEKLRKIGAQKIFEGELLTLYFDFEDRRLEREGKVLRLRKKEDAVILTYKKVLSQDKAKIMEEYELLVNSPELMQKIFKGLGVLPLYELRKRRISYNLDKINFEIDKYPEIPAFLEVEVSSLEELDGIISKLGFSREDAKPFSIKEVLQYYGKI